MNTLETFFLKIVSYEEKVSNFVPMEEKRLDIILRASLVFMKFGIKSVTLDDLCRELGMSKKTLYKYFKDKNDLIKKTFEFHLENDKAQCIHFNKIGENAVDSLIQLSQYIIAQFSEINPAIFFDMKKYYPEAWKMMEDHKHGFIFSKIKENIERGVKEGLYRDNMNPDIIAELYVGSVDVVTNNTSLLSKFKIKDIYKEIIRYQIRGIVNDEGIKYLKQKFNHEINE